MPAQHLHGHRKYPQQNPTQAGLLEDAIYGKEDQRRPSDGAKVRQMPGVDVEHMGAAEHEQHRAQKAGQRLQAAPGRPQPGEYARQEYV